MSLPDAGMASWSTHPIGRFVRVDQQQVGERVRERSPAGLGSVVARLRGDRRAQRHVGDARQRQPLESAIGTDEPRHEIRRGVRQDLRRRPELGEQAALPHDRDEVAHLDRLVDVVGHEQDRLGEALLEVEELVLEALADDRVDGAERLVHEHHRRVDGEGARHADTLALASRELARVALAVGGRLEAHEREQFVDAIAGPVAVPAEQARDHRHVLADREVWEQPGLLDHVPDAAAQGDGILRGDVTAADADVPGGRLDQPVDHLEAGGLAAAGRPDEHADAAGRHDETQVVDGAGAAGAPPGSRPA